jgi:hypothetical protein
MNPGDLIIPLPEYTESRRPPMGIIIREENLSDAVQNFAGVNRYIVLFPEGLSPMYDFEMELVCESG